MTWAKTQDVMLILYVDDSTWSPKLSDLVKSSQVAIMPYELAVDYNYWTYRTYVGD